jgi:hypothetical protein
MNVLVSSPLGFSYVSLALLLALLAAACVAVPVEDELVPHIYVESEEDAIAAATYFRERRGLLLPLFPVLDLVLSLCFFATLCDVSLQRLERVFTLTNKEAPLLLPRR